jgi:hypothetical protein
MTIVAPLDGEVIGAIWTQAVTDAINGIVAAVPVSAKDSSVADGTTTSTSFANSLTSTTMRGIQFTAPNSGTVLVSGSATGRNGTANQFSLMDFEVRQGSTIGSGTLIRASDENTTTSFQSDSITHQGWLAITPTIVSGLTPGAVYNALLTYRTTGGTSTFNRRKITVDPR